MTLSHVMVVLDPILMHLVYGVVYTVDVVHEVVEPKRRGLGLWTVGHERMLPIIDEHTNQHMNYKINTHYTYIGLLMTMVDIYIYNSIPGSRNGESCGYYYVGDTASS